MRWIARLFGRGPVPAAPAAAPAWGGEMQEAAPAATAEPAAHWSVRLAALALPAEATDPAVQMRLLSEVEASLLRLVHERVRLPRRPQLLPQLLGMLNDDRASGRQIAEVIGRDPALATNLLRVANSPMYRVHSSAVESLGRAVAMVGTDGLRQLVAVALMQPVMRLEGGATGTLPERVWEHTELSAGLAARAASGRGGDAVFAAQMLALLQGLGSIMVVQALRDACERLGCDAPDAPTTGELLQRWSARIGRGIAQAWELPALDGLQGLSSLAGLDAVLEMASAAAVEQMVAASQPEHEPATEPDVADAS